MVVTKYFLFILVEFSTFILLIQMLFISLGLYFYIHIK